MSRLTGSEVKSLMEAYSAVYDSQEIIDEQDTVLGRKGQDWYAVTKDASGKKTGEKKLNPSEVGTKTRERYERLRSQDWRSKISQKDPATLSREAEQARKDQLARASKKPDTTPTPPPRPTASDSTLTPTPRPAAPVLSKKGGVEGTGVGKDFKAKSWSDTERQRYTSASAKAAPAKPATGMLGKTSFERRTPTSAEFKAAAKERAGGEKSPEKVLQAAKSAGGALSQATAKVMEKPPAFSPTPAVAKPTPVAPKAPTAGRDQMLQRNLRNGMEYDAYDLVLEYLLSQGHTDTVEEAHYVMMVMDAEMIGDIVEGYQELNYKRRNRMTDQAMRHMNKGDDASWEKAYSIENQRDTQTPEVSKAKAAANKKRGAAKRGEG